MFHNKELKLLLKSLIKFSWITCDCHIIFQRFFRSSQQRCSMEKGVLRNFSKFRGKHLCQSLFFNKVTDLGCNFIKKETLAQVFCCDFWEISKNNVFTEHICATPSGSLTMIKDGKISVGKETFSFLCKFPCFIPCVCTFFH